MLLFFFPANLVRVFFLSVQGPGFPKAFQGYNHICSANVAIGMFPSQDECCACWDTLEGRSRSSASGSFDCMNTGIWLHLYPVVWLLQRISTSGTAPFPTTDIIYSAHRISVSMYEQRAETLNIQTETEWKWLECKGKKGHQQQNVNQSRFWQ